MFTMHESFATYSQNYSGGLQKELVHALSQTTQKDLTAWGKRSATRFTTVAVKRVTNLTSVLSRLTTKTADELLYAIYAIGNGRAFEHFKDRSGKATDTARQVSESIETTCQGISALFKDRPEEAATRLLSTVIGFYAGGGTGDGGIPDLDLSLGGIGWHRSIFTHSIIAGALVETAVLSLIDLNQTVHEKLPEHHSRFWDELLLYSDAAGSSFVTGTSLGIASHLGIDTFIDGFTPYKDLPISLPEAVHQVLMGLNSAAEGAYSLSKTNYEWSGLKSGLHSNQFSQCSQRYQIMNLLCQEKNVQQEKQNIPQLRKILSESPLEERLGMAGEIGQKIASETGINAVPLLESLDAASRKINAAKEPFRLGVIGEFRVGKSTLINALLGQEVAFTDIIEATATECRFKYGPILSASLIYKDGNSEVLSIEEANNCLSDRREDYTWLNSLDHVEYQVPSEILHSFDMWDAPGLGGSEGNEQLANRFLERLGGALWVIDANLVGKASIAGPLQYLKSAGKPLICVINRIDEYQGDPSEIVQFVQRSYPDIFSDVVTISALNALEKTATGVSDVTLDELWNKVLTVMGNDEIQGEAVRVAKTINVAAKDVGQALTVLRRSLQDRIGLVEHSRFNLIAAKNSLFRLLPSIIAEETEKAFSDMEAQLWSLVDAPQTFILGKNPVDQVITTLNNEKTLSKLTDCVILRAMERINVEWSQLTSEAMNLSRIAVALPINALTEFSVDRSAAKLSDLNSAAIEQGIYVGGVSAVIAGTIAVASAAVTWPVILAAIPIGALAAWKEQKRLEHGKGDFVAQVKELLATMKAEFARQLGEEIRSSIESTIDEEISYTLARRTTEAVGFEDIQIAREHENVLLLLESSLGLPPVNAAANVWTSENVLCLLENPGNRVDILLPEVCSSLVPLLVCLPPDTEIRVLIATDTDSRPSLSTEIDAAFGGWQGGKRIRAVSLISGERPKGLPTLLITAEESLISDLPLSSLADRTALFAPYPQGRLAAQRLFAELWEGKGPSGQPLEVSPVF